MHLVSSFEQSPWLELAIYQLREAGIAEADIAAIPLDPVATPTHIFDTIHRADGRSLLDLSAVLATVGAVVGASLGFHLAWGPIICGLAGFAAGAVTGLVFDLLVTGSRRRRQTALSRIDIVLVVRCETAQAGTVRAILQTCRASGIGWADEGGPGTSDGGSGAARTGNEGYGSAGSPSNGQSGCGRDGTRDGGPSPSNANGAKPPQAAAHQP